MSSWLEHEQREAVRYEDGLARLPDAGDERQRQLVRVANAACGAGLACLMAGRRAEATAWLRRSAERYRESYGGAPPESWGRLVAAIKMRLLAGDTDGLEADARWALEQGSAAATSPIGRYAAVLAHLAHGDDDRAEPLAEALRALPEERFPRAVADALAGLARSDGAVYEDGLGRTLRLFEERESYLEGIPVADTVLALEALAERRGLAVRPASPVLPPVAAA